MGTLVLILVVIVILWALLKENHKVLLALSILSIFADNFRVDLGASLLLINFIGFILFPVVLKKIRFINNNFAQNLLTPLWLYWIYLIILGVVFGFLFPWEDLSSYRTWGQKAGGRTIITLLRYLNEIILCYYIIWILVTKKITFRFVIDCVGWLTLFSFFVGIIDYSIGYKIKSSLFYMVPELSDRFLGLNGEPKMFGRNSALAYVLILLYHLHKEKRTIHLLFIIINAIGVILSFSASSLIMFALFNIVILVRTLNVKTLIFSIIFSGGFIFILSNMPFFTTGTLYKIEKAFYGDGQKVTPHEPTLFSRFDIFDRLALNFLYDNPGYAITGTGPNLISIPASNYVGSLNIYSSFNERGGIDSVPNVMLNNIIASGGLLGVIIYYIFIVKLYRNSIKHKNKFAVDLLTINIIFNMVYFSIVFIFISALIIASNNLSKKKLKH